MKLDDRIQWLEEDTGEYLRLIESADENEEKLKEIQKRSERYKGYWDLMERENLFEKVLMKLDPMYISYLCHRIVTRI